MAGRLAAWCDRSLAGDEASLESRRGSGRSGRSKNFGGRCTGTSGSAMPARSSSDTAIAPRVPCGVRSSKRGALRNATTRVSRHSRAIHGPPVRFLHDPPYIGIVDVPDYGARRKRGDFEALISEEVFQEFRPFSPDVCSPRHRTSVIARSVRVGLYGDPTRPPIPTYRSVRAISIRGWTQTAARSTRRSRRRPSKATPSRCVRASMT